MFENLFRRKTWTKVFEGRATAKKTYYDGDVVRESCVVTIERCGDGRERAWIITADKKEPIQPEYVRAHFTK